MPITKDTHYLCFEEEYRRPFPVEQGDDVVLRVRYVNLLCPLVEKHPHRFFEEAGIDVPVNNVEGIDLELSPSRLPSGHLFGT